MQLRPLHDRVVVKRVEEEDTTRGGIIIPDTAKEKPKRGDVVAVGPGKKSDTGQTLEPSVQPGDRVVFNTFAGTEVSIEGEEHLVMREDDIIARIEA